MRQGKGLRPALCLAACEAFGGTVEDALPAAAALELLHAAFLIHDDIEDGTEQRRGRSAMHVEYGVPIALNAGDALATLALRPLLDEIDRLGSRMTRAVLAEFQRAMERTVEGQAVEIGWRADNVVDLTPVDYLDMILRKTCAYTTILPLRVGALIGSWGAADLDAIALYGFALGAAFQIQDDMLDLVSASGSYGKDLLGDVREGKRTLMLLHLVRAAAPRPGVRRAVPGRPARGPLRTRRAPDRRPHGRLRQHRLCASYAAEMAARRERPLRRRVRRLPRLANRCGSSARSSRSWSSGRRRFGGPRPGPVAARLVRLVVARHAVEERAARAPRSRPGCPTRPPPRCSRR